MVKYKTYSKSKKKGEDIMAIRKEEVKYIAQLAKLHFEEDEAEKFAKEFENKSGQVILGKHEDAEYGAALTLHKDKKALIILKEKKELATIPYQAINQESIQDKKALTKAISKDWFQANRLAVSLFLVLFSGFLSAVNFAILVFGASFFLFLTRKSRLFSLKTFKECFNFTLNCLGLPILVSVLISLEFHQVFTTTILIQNILFVLFLALAFYKTHFRDPDYKPKGGTL